MAADCKMDDSVLIAELLKTINKDLETLKTRVSELPAKPPVDYQAHIEGLTKAVSSLQNGSTPVPPVVDLSGITTRLDRMEQQSRQRPEYKMSQYVQYGSYAFGLMVVLLVAATWLALDWKGERDRYEQAHAHDNWRVRYTEQANPDYYAYMEGVFRKEPAKVYQWVEEQEQADQKRALAAQAAEQAKALSDQANQLEGKPRVKGKKKG